MHSNAFTSAALTCSFAPTSAVNICICRIKCVSMFAVSLCSILCNWTVIPQDVHSHRDWFKVQGMHAPFVTAKVVECQTVRNRTDQHRVCKSVSFNCDGGALRNGESTVSTMQRSCPFPARCFADLYISPESLFESAKTRCCKRISVPLPSHVVSAAETASDATLAASIDSTELNWSRHTRQFNT